MAHIKLKSLLENSTQSFSYGCVMLYFDFPEMDKIHSIIKKGDVHIKPGDDSYGLEDNPHCTLLYGLHEEVGVGQIKSIIEKFNYSSCELYNCSLFETDNYDVLKFDVRGENLSETNEELKKLPHTSTFPDYHPHMTIAYLKKGSGKKYVEVLKAAIFKVRPEHVIYSEVDDSENQIPINITEISSSAKYYQNNPEARKKKQAYDAKLNKRPEQVKSRVETNKARREAVKAGKNIKGKDASHTKNGIRFKESSKNRGSKSDSAGDRRARGGKKKK